VPSATDGEPLCVGLERSQSGSSFVLDANSLRTGNLPPQRFSKGKAIGAQEAYASNSKSVSGMLTIPVTALQDLKAELYSFDVETQQDVCRFRLRIAE
ncbi:unnamed protein product, partial [Polarella glacialis]